jgi:hypothetical protein
LHSRTPTFLRRGPHHGARLVESGIPASCYGASLIGGNPWRRKICACSGLMILSMVLLTIDQ